MLWPDWNVRSDPLATQIVLSAGVPVTMIGWDITIRCQLCVNDIERLHSKEHTCCVPLDVAAST